MSVNKYLVFLVTSLLMVTSAFGASKSRELSLDGNYIGVNGESASLLNVTLGQFITPQVVVATGLTSQRNFGYTGTSIFVGGKYYFMDGFKGDLIPFAGADIGLRMMATATDSNHGSTQYGVSAGVAFFLSDSTTLDAKIKLLNFNDSSPAITQISAGFSQRF